MCIGTVYISYLIKINDSIFHFNVDFLNGLFLSVNGAHSYRHLSFPHFVPFFMLPLLLLLRLPVCCFNFQPKHSHETELFIISVLTMPNCVYSLKVIATKIKQYTNDFSLLTSLHFMSAYTMPFGRERRECSATLQFYTVYFAYHNSQSFTRTTSNAFISFRWRFCPSYNCSVVSFYLKMNSEFLLSHCLTFFSAKKH